METDRLTDSTQSNTCSPRHILGTNFKCVNCGKSSQECHDDFELRQMACGCFDIFFSDDTMGFVECADHAEASMWEMG